MTSLKDAFKARKSILAYAVKANSNLSVVKHFAKMGSGADCVSIGEVRRAFLAGIPAYKIIFSGVGKSDDESIIVNYVIYILYVINIIYVINILYVIYIIYVINILYVINIVCYLYTICYLYYTCY